VAEERGGDAVGLDDAAVVRDDEEPLVQAGEQRAGVRHQRGGLAPGRRVLVSVTGYASESGDGVALLIRHCSYAPGRVRAAFFAAYGCCE
jgi:hypothetical protein